MNPPGASDVSFELMLTFPFPSVEKKNNAIDPHRDIPVRRVVSPGEQTIPQERVQVQIDELNVELFTPQ